MFGMRMKLTGMGRNGNGESHSRTPLDRGCMTMPVNSPGGNTCSGAQDDRYV